MGKTLDTELVGLTWAQLLPAPDILRGTLTDVTDLAASIAKVGVLQPLRVHPHPTAKGKWEIIAGHRRHAAVGRLIEQGVWRKTDVIPCVLDPAVDDQARLQAMLIENLQRVDLDPIEEGRGYQRLHDEFGHSVRAIADLVGRSKTVVGARTSLLKLPDSIQRKVSTGELALELAGMMTRLPADRADRLANLPHLTDDEIRRDVLLWEQHEFKRKATEAANAAGLPVSDQPEWQLHSKHNRVHRQITPAQLDKVILPDETDGWCVTIDVHNRWLTVWAPDPDRTTSAPTVNVGVPDFDTDPYKRVEVDVLAWNGHLRETAARLRHTYNEAHDAKMGEVARMLAGDKALIAASAISFIVQWAVEGDGVSEVHGLRWEDLTWAKQIGFRPTEGDDVDEFEELEAWLTDTANQYALAALMLASENDFTTPVTAKAAEIIDQELGPRPDPADLVDVPACHRDALAFYESLPDNNSSKAEGIATFSRLIVEDPDNADPHLDPDDEDDDGDGEGRPCACGNPTADGEHFDDECVLDHDDDLVALRDEADGLADDDDDLVEVG